jgi:hypothetical protein
MKGYPVFGELLMIQVPGLLLARFEACLAAKNISKNLRLHYKWWRRFYLDSNGDVPRFLVCWH